MGLVGVLGHALLGFVGVPSCCYLGFYWCSWSFTLLSFVNVPSHVLLVSAIVRVVGSWIMMGKS